MSIVRHISDIEEMLSGTVYCIDNICKGFKQFDTEPLKKVTCFLDGFQARVPGLTENIISESKNDPSASRYVVVPSILGNMQEDVQELAANINKIAVEKILFSDKAISEIVYIFERLIDLIVSLKEHSTNETDITKTNVLNSSSAVYKLASDYAHSHEERLISGVCTPAASAVYIKILGAVKNIALHITGIAQR